MYRTRQRRLQRGQRPNPASAEACRGLSVTDFCRNLPEPDGGDLDPLGFTPSPRMYSARSKRLRGLRQLGALSHNVLSGIHPCSALQIFRNHTGNRFSADLEFRQATFRRNHQSHARRRRRERFISPLAELNPQLRAAIERGKVSSRLRNDRKTAAGAAAAASNPLLLPPASDPGGQADQKISREKLSACSTAVMTHTRHPSSSHFRVHACPTPQGIREQRGCLIARPHLPICHYRLWSMSI